MVVVAGRMMVIGAAVSVEVVPEEDLEVVVAVLAAVAHRGGGK